jgi:hypothetical protein
MEGDNKERRKKSREAREQGKRPSAEQVTTGASKQSRRFEGGHVEEIEAIRKGKQPMLVQKTPKPTPHSR